MEEDKHVVVTIKPSGKVGVEANNFNGVGCTEATEQIEVALGAGVKRDFKPEYHNPAVDSIAETIQQDF